MPNNRESANMQNQSDLFRIMLNDDGITREIENVETTDEGEARR